MGNTTLHKRVEELEEELVAIRKHIGLSDNAEDDGEDDDDVNDESDEADDDDE